MLPLATILLLTEVSFVVALSPLNSENYLFFSDQPTAFEDARIEGAEALRRQIQALLYIVVAGLAWVHRRSVLALVGAYPHLVVILAWVLMGALYSADPVKVITNTILLTVALLIAALHALGSERYDRFRCFYLSMLVPMALVHLGSLLLFALYPVDLGAYLDGTQRYGGSRRQPQLARRLGRHGAVGRGLAAGRRAPRRSASARSPRSPSACSSSASCCRAAARPRSWHCWWWWPWCTCGAWRGWPASGVRC